MRQGSRSISTTLGSTELAGTDPRVKGIRSARRAIRFMLLPNAPAQRRAHSAPCLPALVRCSGSLGGRRVAALVAAPVRQMEAVIRLIGDDEYILTFRPNRRPLVSEQGFHRLQQAAVLRRYLHKRVVRH